MSPADSLSRAPVGSSAKTIAGSLTSARAIATRCRCPPLRAAGRLPALSGRPTRSRARSARARAALGRLPETSSGSSTFSTAERTGSRL